MLDTMSNMFDTQPTETTAMTTSFAERSAWVQLASLLLVLGGYSWIAGRMMAQGITALPAYAAVFTVLVVLQVAVLIAGHVVAAIAGRADDGDERDRLIGWRAESYSGWVLAAGVLTAVAAMVLAVPNLWVAHLLLLSLFLSEILKLVIQLFFYRRGL